MALPPAIPEPPAFRKHRSKKSHRAHEAHHRHGGEFYDDDEFRRGQWLLVGGLLVALAIGGWLIFSGLL